MGSSKPNFNELVKKMGFDDTKESVIETEKSEVVKQPPLMQPHQTEKGTLIAEDVVITGDIKARQNIEFCGEIKGNIETAGILQLNGKAEGNIKADNLILQNAIVHGNVTSNNQISIDRDTEVVGDLTARSIIIGGNLKGNVFAEESVLIQEQAVIKGDISTGLIDIRQGAQLSGKVETGVDVKNKKKAE